jgi:hypothetical protein
MFAKTEVTKQLRYWLQQLVYLDPGVEMGVDDRCSSVVIVDPTTVGVNSRQHLDSVLNTSTRAGGAEMCDVLATKVERGLSQSRHQRL